MDEKWLKDIEKQLAGYEAKAPEGLWERISSLLTANVARRRTIPLVRRRSFRTYAYRIAAVVVLIVLIGGGLFIDLSYEDASMNHQPSVSQPNRSASSSVSEKASSIFKVIPSTIAEPVRMTSGSQQLFASSVHVAEPRDTITPVAQPLSDGGTASAQQQSVTEKEGDSTEKATRHTSSAGAKRGYFIPGSQQSSSKQKPLSISLLATNVISDNRQTNGPGGVALMSSDQAMASDPICNQIQSGYGAVNKHLIGNDGARIFDQEKHHKQPVRVGVSVAYPLTDRLSLGLGLYYTYLSSDFKTGSEYSYQSAHQSLHYIGVPLSVNYAFYRSSRFLFYATGGAMAEKCVSGESEIQTVNGRSSETTTQPFTEHRLQYSVFGSVGVQLDLLPHVGLYMEPGLSYYFDNHSQVVNLYKDEPLQFNLSAGVRFSF